MKAMLLTHLASLEENPAPLQSANILEPRPEAGEILIEVAACGVCHTELDEIEGRTPPPRLPVVPGHQVVGRVVEQGAEAKRFQIGERVGVAWIYSACGRCKFCLSGRENLCAQFRATGRDANGGYAQYLRVGETFAYRIPDSLSDEEAAPLLCAGAIGYRSLKLSGLHDGQSLGLAGFGGSGHLALKLAQQAFPDSPVFVFSRSEGEREFALQLGAAWAGDFGETPPALLDCVIETTPAWRPVLESLRCLAPGGRLVINVIRKEEMDKERLLELDYAAHLWQEKEIKSVANITRADVQEFLDLAAQVPLRPEVQVYPLKEANRALQELKQRNIRGAKVLKIR